MVRQNLNSLQAAIAGLYSRFEKYELHKNIDGCPCCVTDADNRTLHAVPLRELTPQHLQRYASQALTTWGDGRDFRHFLPRLLELLAYDDLGVEIEVVVGKLSYADWSRWPADERTAVNVFLKSWWRDFLNTVPDPEHDVVNVDDMLCAIGQAVDDLAW